MTKWYCHDPAVWLKTSFFTSPNFSFLELGRRHLFSRVERKNLKDQMVKVMGGGAGTRAALKAANRL